MKSTGRRANNQPEAARTSVFHSELRAVPCPVSRVVENAPIPRKRATAALAAVLRSGPDAGVA
jgi:hypothetical protein